MKAILKWVDYPERSVLMCGKIAVGEVRKQTDGLFHTHAQLLMDSKYLTMVNAKNMLETYLDLATESDAPKFQIGQTVYWGALHTTNETHARIPDAKFDMYVHTDTIAEVLITADGVIYCCRYGSGIRKFSPDQLFASREEVIEKFRSMFNEALERCSAQGGGE